MSWRQWASLTFFQLSVGIFMIQNTESGASRASWLIVILWGPGSRTQVPVVPFWPLNELLKVKTMLTLHYSLASHNFKQVGFIKIGLFLAHNLHLFIFPIFFYCDGYVILCSILSSNYFHPFLFFLILFYVSDFHFVCMCVFNICLSSSPLSNTRIGSYLA